MQRKGLQVTAIPIFVGALLLGACGDEGAGAAPDVTWREGGTSVTSGAMVDPDARLTYQGKTYRLAAFEQADLVESSMFRQVGEVTTVNIETGDSVFLRAGEPSVVYTLSEARGSGDASSPALWMRWEPTDA